MWHSLMGARRMIPIWLGNTAVIRPQSKWSTTATAISNQLLFNIVLLPLPCPGPSHPVATSCWCSLCLTSVWHLTASLLTTPASLMVPRYRQVIEELARGLFLQNLASDLLSLYAALPLQNHPVLLRNQNHSSLQETGGNLVTLAREEGSLPQAKTGGSVAQVRTGGSVPQARIGGSLARARTGGWLPQAKAGESLRRVRTGGSVPRDRTGGSLQGARIGEMAPLVRIGGSVSQTQTGGS